MERVSAVPAAAVSAEAAPAALDTLRIRSERRNDMADAIVVLVVVVVVIFAAKSAIKHFRGEGACCGDGSSKVSGAPDKVLEGPVIGRKTLHISGMHCQNCVNSVTKALNQIQGVSASVNLDKKAAVVSYDREVNESEMINAVRKAGFTVDFVDRY